MTIKIKRYKKKQTKKYSNRKLNYTQKKRGPFIVRESSTSHGDYSTQTTDDSVRKKTYSVISLFSGCGGLDLGFVGGFKFLGRKYEKNDFKAIWADAIGEPSCQTFANYLKIIFFIFPSQKFKT